MNVLAKVPVLQSRGVEKQSSMRGRGRLVAVALALLACALLAAAYTSQPSTILRAFAPRSEPLARQLDEAIGATVEPLDPATARSLGLSRESRGLVVTSVATGGPAARAGVRTGDVVVGIERPVGSIKDLAADIQRNGNKLTVTLNRHGQSVILPLRVGVPSQRPLDEQE